MMVGSKRDGGGLPVANSSSSYDSPRVDTRSVRMGRRGYRRHDRAGRRRKDPAAHFGHVAQSGRLSQPYLALLFSWLHLLIPLLLVIRTPVVLAC